MDTSGTRPLVFLGLSVIILLLLSAWSLKGGFLGASFRIERAVICRELSGDRQPVGIGSSIPYGSRQICLWFSYSSASEGSRITVSWYYGKELVLSESFKLMAENGERAFYLLREEGTPLPVGAYRVTVSTPTKTLSEIKFSVVRRK